MGTFAPISSFIGRQAEIQQVRQVLDSGACLITLTGPGGVGKTRLAQEVTTQTAAGYADGAFFIPLDALAEPGQVLPKIASTLEVSESGRTSILEDLCVALADRHTLLCVEKWEHVLEAALQVADLLAACPHLHMLATSREALRLRGEQKMGAAPLVRGEGEEKFFQVAHSL